MAGYDFDDFLAESVRRENLRADNEQRQIPITAKLQDALDELQVPRIFDFDPDVARELRNEYFQVCRQELLEKYPEDTSMAWLEDNPEMLEEAIDIESETLVAREVIFESSVIEMARVLITLEQVGKENNDEMVMSRVTDGKKRCMANLVVSEGLSTDNPWYRFIDTVVPGEGLDPNSDTDGKYMSAANEKLARDEARERLFDEYIVEALTASGIDRSYPNEKEVVHGRDIINYAGIVSRDYAVKSLNLTSDEQIRASWEEHLREAARQDGTPNEIVEKLITFFEHALPKLLNDEKTSDD